MSQQQQQQQNNPSGLGFLWGFVAICVVALLIWYFGKVYITAFVYGLRYYELLLIQAVASGWQVIADYVPVSLPVFDAHKLQALLNHVSHRPDDITLETLTDVSTDVGKYLSIPVALILGILSIYLFTKHITLKYKTIFNMLRLKKIEQKNWPQITPVTNVDLLKPGLDEGVWAMAMTPMQFAKKHQLLREYHEDGAVTVSLKQGMAQRVFAMQLGQPFSRVEAMPIHYQALFAVFAARINRDQDSADKLLYQISRSAGHSGKLNFSGVHAVVNKYKNSKLITLALAKHAYNLTMLASLLELARADGVVASADFLWLKVLDRKLWYTLNCVGRQTAFPEVAGIFAHWLAEKRLQRPLISPLVDQAVRALEMALKELIYEPEEKN